MSSIGQSQTRLIRMSMTLLDRRLGLELDPGNQEFIRLEKMLSTQIYQIFWEEGGFDKLDFALEEIVRSNRATTAIYHDLALVYTRLALLKDDMAVSTKGDGKSVAFSIENQRTPTNIPVFQDQAHNDYWLLAIDADRRALG